MNSEQQAQHAQNQQQTIADQAQIRHDDALKAINLDLQQNIASLEELPEFVNEFESLVTTVAKPFDNTVKQDLIREMKNIQELYGKSANRSFRCVPITHPASRGARQDL